MKLITLIIAFITYSCTLPTSNTKHEIDSVKSNITSKTTEALKFCLENNMNTDFCILIDMSVHSGKNRFIVWDFKTQKVIKTGLVAHGCGKNTWSSDETKKDPIFSNVNNSHLSSLGKYSVGKRGWSNWGIHINYKLNGLEPTNDNAYKRLIVLHGWDSVTDEEIYPNGTTEGWGCPAVSNNIMKFLDSKLRYEEKQTLFWIYK